MREAQLSQPQQHIGACALGRNEDAGVQHLSINGGHLRQFARMRQSCRRIQQQIAAGGHVPQQVNQRQRRRMCPAFQQGGGGLPPQPIIQRVTTGTQLAVQQIVAPNLHQRLADLAEHRVAIGQGHVARQLIEY